MPFLADILHCRVHSPNPPLPPWRVVHTLAPFGANAGFSILDRRLDRHQGCVGSRGAPQCKTLGGVLLVGLHSTLRAPRASSASKSLSAVRSETPHSKSRRAGCDTLTSMAGGLQPLSITKTCSACLLPLTEKRPAIAMQAKVVPPARFIVLLESESWVWGCDP
jgi:hypothetical protein